MGCGGSSEAAKPPAPPPAQPPPQQQVVMQAQGQMVAPMAQPQVMMQQPMMMQQPQQPVGKFQIMLGGDWKDYGPEEDAILKRAYLTGFPKAKFHLRGQDYQYDFQRMVQINEQSKKERQIKAPAITPPSAPLVPPGPTMVVVIPQNPGAMMMIPHPQSPGEQIQVQVPPGAKPGQNMVVPVPKKGMGVAGKAAVGVGAVGVVGGMAVAGAIIGAGAQDMAGAEAAVNVLGGALADGAGDAGDWLGGAGEQAADFVMDLFN